MIAREHSGLRGFARAPWDAPDTTAADALADRAAAARVVLAGAEDADPRHVAAALGIGAASLRMRATSAGRFGAVALRTAYLSGDPAAVSAGAWWESLS